LVSWDRNDALYFLVSRGVGFFLNLPSSIINFMCSPVWYAKVAEVSLQQPTHEVI
jgi:hypothetical protein